jgi:hypothetical protein
VTLLFGSSFQPRRYNVIDVQNALASLAGDVELIAHYEESPLNRHHEIECFLDTTFGSIESYHYRDNSRLSSTTTRQGYVRSPKGAHGGRPYNLRLLSAGLSSGLAQHDEGSA